MSLYNDEESPTDRDLAERLLDAYELADRWQQIIQDFYGEKVAEQLKAIAPADPYLLYDLAVKSYIDEGKTEQEAIETVDNYTVKEWAGNWFKRL